MGSKNTEVTTVVSASASAAEISRNWVILSGLLVFAFALRIWDISWGLPQIYEEAIPLHFGMKFWDLKNSPIDYHYFVYPSLTYFLHYIVQAVHFAVGYVLGLYESGQAFFKIYKSNPTMFVVLGRLVTVFFDLGTIIITFFSLRRFLNLAAAVISAFFISINALHISQAHTINVDTPLAFFSVLSFYFFLRLYDSPVKKWYLLSGIAIGLASSTKYNGAVLVVGLLLVHLLRQDSIFTSFKSHQIKLLLSGFLSSAGVFVLLNPLILTHFDEFLFKFRATELHMEAGHLGIDYSSSTLGFYLTQSFPNNVGWVLFVVTIISALWIIFSKTRRNFILLIIPLLLFIPLASWQMRADRYIFPLIPFLIAIASFGIAKSADLLRAIILRKVVKPGIDKLIFASYIVTAISAASVSALGNDLGYFHALSMPDTRTVAKQWIEKNLKPGSAIAAGPFGIELSDSVFLKLPIQFNAVNSEEMAPFYDTRWYEDLDLLVASDFDYARYLQDTIRYKNMLHFYDSLRLNWNLQKTFKAGEDYTGPTLWFYRYQESSRREYLDPLLLQNLELSGLVTERKVDFLGKLGLILLSKGRVKKSEQLFVSLLRIDPTNREAQNTISQISQRMKRRIQSEDLVDDSLLAESARKSLEEERYEAADSLYNALLEKDPRSNEAFQGLMLIYAYEGKQDKVIEILSRYLNVLPPGSIQYKLVEKQLKVMKSRQ